MEYFYEGKVLMRAWTLDAGGTAQEFVEEQTFDHSNKEARFAVRNFVHKHLCEGHLVESFPE